MLSIKQTHIIFYNLLSQLHPAASLFYSPVKENVYTYAQMIEKDFVFSTRIIFAIFSLNSRCLKLLTPTPLNRVHTFHPVIMAQVVR